ncbi:dynein-related subfamily AAA family protein [Saccharothrix carnea]|uniref:Dynein-related subfamily AAA family protein n=1 Tax=Saccharothrix carnea TaxID=1280637 RepID=A0A2P8I118_SACCR|nr:AAA family ATPase [Saccharothrix carnea]PSL52167.1 dynein-related subfamily AAA family protein [Saccharothrix carnea]
MRTSTKSEVAQIAEAVARTVFTQSNLLWMVQGEIQARLPETIRRHAHAALPTLARAAVAEATPDLAEMRAAVEGAARKALEEDLPVLVNQTADGLLPDLARAAVRDATPDAAKVREELVAAVGSEVTGIVRGQAGDVLADVVRQATEQVRDAVTSTLEQQSEEVIAELARAAVAKATPDRDRVRDELVHAGSAAMVEVVRAAVEEAAPGAVRDEAEKVRGSLADAVRRVAEEVLPGLARDAVAGATPDLRQMHDELAGKAAVTATELAREATREALPGVVDEVSGEALNSVRRAVRDEAEKVFAQYAPNVVTVVLPQGGKVELGADTHSVLPELLVALHARCHVLLVGPAGTGKSMLAKHAAGALGLEFQALSLGPTTPMSKVFGYYDAHGQYHDTPFRRAFEHGGVMLLDELDNGHPGLLAELNQALALGTCAFADRMVDAHENFRLVATGNTYGTGGDRQYVGRQTLDSATLDRFVVIDVPIDEGLEERIALRHAPSHPDAVQELLEEVRELRGLAGEKKLPVLFSPRTSIDGAKLLEAGATLDQVIQWRVVRGLSDAHRKALGLD